MTPGSGESLRPQGGPPVFRIGERTLQVQSIDLADGTFTLASLDAAADRRIPLTIGAQLPDFVFTDYSGARHHLSDVKARLVLLDFWATWCAPCMADMPKLQQAYTTFRDHGFEILGMNGDHSPDAPAQVIRTKGLSWPEAQYDKSLIEDQFQISQWPTRVLIDQNRTILSIGKPDHLPLDGDHLPATLSALLAKKSSGQ
jgi:thiol-disulfide isomerase/thioredoxin